MKTQKEHTSKDTVTRTLVESRVMMCQNFTRPFESEKFFRKHDHVCHDQLTSLTSNRKTSVFRPVTDRGIQRGVWGERWDHVQGQEQKRREPVHCVP